MIYCSGKRGTSACSLDTLPSAPACVFRHSPSILVHHSLIPRPPPADGFLRHGSHRCRGEADGGRRLQRSDNVGTIGVTSDSTDCRCTRRRSSTFALRRVEVPFAERKATIRVPRGQCRNSNSGSRAARGVSGHSSRMRGRQAVSRCMH
jgi:hypothetical protein